MGRLLAVCCVLSLSPSIASAAAPDCGVEEHDSGGHCCRAGEEWVPAKRKCVCLEPEVCGGKSAPAKAKPAKAAPAPKPAQNQKDGWTQVGEALVQVLEFENMVSTMRNFGSDYPRMAYAEELGKAKRRFSCQQIARLMATSGIDTTGVEIAFHLFPHASDPQNFATLITGLNQPAFSQLYLKQRLGRE
jgi:hypothetical protein